MSNHGGTTPQLGTAPSALQILRASPSERSKGPLRRQRLNPNPNPTWQEESFDTFAKLDSHAPLIPGNVHAKRRAKIEKSGKWPPSNPTLRRPAGFSKLFGTPAFKRVEEARRLGRKDIAAKAEGRVSPEMKKLHNKYGDEKEWDEEKKRVRRNKKKLKGKQDQAVLDAQAERSLPMLEFEKNMTRNLVQLNADGIHNDSVTNVDLTTGKLTIGGKVRPLGVRKPR